MSEEVGVTSGVVVYQSQGGRRTDGGGEGRGSSSTRTSLSWDSEGSEAVDSDVASHGDISVEHDVVVSPVCPQVLGRSVGSGAGPGSDDAGIVPVVEHVGSSIPGIEQVVGGQVAIPSESGVSSMHMSYGVSSQQSYCVGQGETHLGHEYFVQLGNTELGPWESSCTSIAVEVVFAAELEGKHDGLGWLRGLNRKLRG